MTKVKRIAVAALASVAVGVAALAVSLDDLDLQHEGKTGLKDLCGVINSNNALIETAIGTLDSGLINQSATNITSGNLAVARITNAAASVGPYIAGNIPVAAITNAAATVGPSIGGNIPVAAMTNGAGTLGPNIGGNIPEAAMTNTLRTSTVTVNFVISSYGQFTNALGVVMASGPYTTNNVTEAGGAPTNAYVFKELTTGVLLLKSKTQL